jgi:hypothetical protein
LTRFFWAALRDVVSSLLHRERLSAAQAGESVQQANVIEAQEIREIIAKLGQAREQHSAAVADKMGAEAEANRSGSEIGQAITQLAAKEKAMALSGGVPDGAFPEEAQIECLQRQRRVVLARVSARNESCATSQKVIDDLKKQLDSAWLQLGVEGCREVIAQFRLAAMALRKAQCEHMAWLRLFSNKPGIPRWQFARVVDPCGKAGCVEIDGCLILDGVLVDDRMIASESYWRPLGGDLADAILALYSEVVAAKGE